ncbi:unnamed protein product [Darwinula stevensoni]|uniref:Uncharacterized protein n=1 Tax=Darwinula stevensoni TaxID=69355 RepID=A0A7R9A310_9CRUS|nr:unnamed protein product [Darwinula stevensoni]CAG0886825.1 unnamed protein product [Darwinula stevensoni]
MSNLKKLKGKAVTYEKEEEGMEGMKKKQKSSPLTGGKKEEEGEAYRQLCRLCSQIDQLMDRASKVKQEAATLDDHFISQIPVLKEKIQNHLKIASKGQQINEQLVYYLTKEVAEFEKELQNVTAIHHQHSLMKEFFPEVNLTKNSTKEKEGSEKEAVLKNPSGGLRVCASCAQPEPKPKTFKKCGACKAENVPHPNYYCGRKCQYEPFSGQPPSPLDFVDLIMPFEVNLSGGLGKATPSGP